MMVIKKKLGKPGFFFANYLKMAFFSAQNWNSSPVESVKRKMSDVIRYTKSAIFSICRKRMCLLLTY